MYMGILSAFMYVHHMYTRCLQRLEESVWYSGTGVTDSGELPYGCWELNQDSPEEQPVFLTAEPSLQPHINFFRDRRLCKPG